MSTLNITRLGVSSAAATSITIPGSYNTGDIIFIFAFNSSAATVPTVPAGWTSLGTNNNNSVGGVLAWKYAASNSETSGTWTNATQLLCAVYHNPSTVRGPIATYSSNAKGNANNNTTVLYQALTPMQSGGTSWVISFAAIKSINTSLATPPTGLTNEYSNTGATVEVALHDSNGPISTFQTASGGNLSVSVGGTAGAWQTWTIELLADGVTKNNRGLRPHAFSPGIAR